LDKVPHRRLVSKLKSHGIQVKILDWISEWLRGRVHRVCIRDVKSSWHYDDAPKWTIACTEMDIFMYRNCSLWCHEIVIVKRWCTENDHHCTGTKNDVPKFTTICPEMDKYRIRPKPI